MSVTFVGSCGFFKATICRPWKILKVAESWQKRFKLFECDNACQVWFPERQRMLATACMAGAPALGAMIGGRQGYIEKRVKRSRSKASRSSKSKTQEA